MDIDIRSLKRRMGWTTSDLARRLGVETRDIEFWENGSVEPSSDQLSQIEFLCRQATLCSEELKSAPIAENILEEKHQDQVRVDEM